MALYRHRPEMERSHKRTPSLSFRLAPRRELIEAALMQGVAGVLALRPLSSSHGRGSYFRRRGADIPLFNPLHQSARSGIKWSGWSGTIRQPRGPKPRALPIELQPECRENTPRRVGSVTSSGVLWEPSAATFFGKMAGRTGLDPVTSCVTGRRSIHLS